MKKILLPYDGSPGARAAVSHVARHHAERYARAEVVLLNVRQVYIDNELAHVARPIVMHHQEEGERALRAASKALTLAGIPNRTEVYFGSPARAIARAAEALGADLVVVGTRDRPRLMRLVSRSVARRVQDISSVPVLLVRAPAGAADLSTFPPELQGASK